MGRWGKGFSFSFSPSPYLPTSSSDLLNILLLSNDDQDIAIL